MSNQLELGFDSSKAARFKRIRPSRSARAHWWFEQMRLAVEQALDWHPAPTARPEQSYLPLNPAR